MLALYHHAPDRADSEVDAMWSEAREQARAQAITLEVVAAFEGMDLTLGSS